MNANVSVIEGQVAARADATAILIDARGMPVSVSGEALRVLLYPGEVPPNGKARRMAARRVHEIFPSGPLSEETEPTGEFMSGRRCYRYRICRLETHSAEGHGPAAVILLERNRPALNPSPDSLAVYRLTAREQQVLRLVLHGMTNKQIAAEIGISSNTVKVFLRLIMTKMGVASRFGILGKLLARTESRAQASGPSVARLARFTVHRKF